MENLFRVKMRSSARMLGSLLFSGSDSIAEMMARVGHDFLVIDAEHTLNTLPNMLAMVRAVQAASQECVPIVRVPTHDPDYLKQVLDGVGVETLMFPFVESEEEAATLVAACFYPPRGRRGHAGTVRPAHYGMWPSYLDVLEQRLCLIAQVETEEAMRRIERIGAVEGIHSVFLGLGDLAVSMGVPAGLADADFRAFVEDAMARCRKARLHVGSFQFSPEHASWFLRQGGRYVSYYSDMRYISVGAQMDLKMLQLLN